MCLFDSQLPFFKLDRLYMDEAGGDEGLKLGAGVTCDGYVVYRWYWGWAPSPALASKHYHVYKPSHHPF